MPYTPPTLRSPASSNTNSPVLSRNHSYEGSIAGSSLRPGLPRSRSAAYISKHRRGPSISDQSQSEESAASRQLHGASHHGLHTHNSTTANTCNGSSPYFTEAVDQLTGEVSTLSSANSSVNTSDDDDRTARARQISALASSLKQNLVFAKRSSSPKREEEDSQPAAAKSTPVLPLSNGTSSPALTPEARKIAHSRSSSEIQLSKLADMPSQAASSDESDDDELSIKPPLLRKKSGELVKPALRPPSRRRPSSMPGTPTFGKAVHFNEDIEQVRHFLQVDRPMAVSAGSSPIETYDSDVEYPFGGKKAQVTEWEIKLSNFPADTQERRWLPVRVEKIFLAADQKMLVGVVAVANIAFQKYVTARFTFDYWKTTSEVAAEFNHDIRKKQADDGYDRFNFNIKLADQAHLETKTLLLCVRYNAGGQEHWDNNNNINHQVDFVKKVAPRKVQPVAGAGTLGTIPRSRHTPPTTQTRPRSFPASSDDDFTAQFEFGSGTILRDAPEPWSRSRGRKGSLYPTQQRRGPAQAGGAFATRYDFGASLSAALTQAQSQLASGPIQPALPRSHSSEGFFSKPAASAPRSSAPAVQPVGGSNPTNISAARPELGSQEYHDLIQKFCYFGSKAGSPGTSSPDAAPKRTETEEKGKAATDGSQSPVDSGSDTSSPPSGTSSASNSPPLELHRSQVDGAHDSHSQRSSRSSTPSFHSTTSPRLIAQYRSPSPALGHELPHQVLAQ